MRCCSSRGRRRASTSPGCRSGYWPSSIVSTCAVARCRSARMRARCDSSLARWISGTSASRAGCAHPEGLLGVVRAAAQDCYAGAVAGSYPSEALLSAARDAVLVVDDARRFVDANPAACRLLGLALKDLLGKRFDDFLDEPGL